ncbi:aminopeptidase [Alkalihalobacillus sp. BA299]|uniref:aminopeptidase n=1 Tax=Alkalihalobacillus sp. BA299 TaxID=2815938 RepID=UPI001FFE0437|nr:aminopeptidase [Alkalihalobacillus sp. BA299]
MSQLNTFLPIVKNMMKQNVCAFGDEYVVVLTDFEKEEIGRLVFDSLCKLSFKTDFVLMQTRSRSGEEPPATIAAMMKTADICFCICQHSLTHTKAKKEASQTGTKVITMPGITMDMFTEGAMKADYEKVEKLTNLFTEKLTASDKIRIQTGQDNEYLLTINIKNREGINSTGVFKNNGASGNLPSGESYIAPQLENSFGEILIDGSIAGIGKVSTPVLLKVENGRLVSASGSEGEKLLELLGEGDGRCIAEFGIGTNNAARVTGNILEDEKAYGTIHIAFGSNLTFGGTIDAGVHLDCVTKKPSVWISSEKVVENGTV